VVVTWDDERATVLLEDAGDDVAGHVEYREHPTVAAMAAVVERRLLEGLVVPSGEGAGPP
jgi:hypothetical protein